MLNGLLHIGFKIESKYSKNVFKNPKYSKHAHTYIHMYVELMNFAPRYLGRPWATFDVLRRSLGNLGRPLVTLHSGTSSSKQADMIFFCNFFFPSKYNLQSM
jgi:hypothetical protein